MTDHSSDLSGLVENGKLKAAINTGNRALVQVEPDGSLGGVSPALATHLADTLGAAFDPVIYDGAGRVFADVGTGAWAVGFLAIDKMRAEKVSFTRPYHTIEATLAVRTGGGIRDLNGFDREGTTILTSTGSAYDMYLTSSLKHASLERSGTPMESFAEFRDGHADAVAGVRESLQRFFAETDEVLILPGALTKVEQAMVLPAPDDPRIGSLDDFVAQAIADGVVARALGD